MSHICVPWSGREVADLSSGVELYTHTIEACLAVCGLQGSKGALMHLQANDPIEDYLAWFRREMVPGSSTNVALVGAMKGKGDGLLEEVRGILQNDGYTIGHERVLTEFVYDLFLSNQRIDLVKQRQMRMGQEISYVPVGTEEIVF
jgi:hypothetical protein